jgi:diguanylate cyclase (GGDEF)-like protein
MELGAYLMRIWGFPEIVSVPIGYHHRAERLSSENHELETMARIVDLAARFIDLFLLPAKTITVGMLEYHARIFGFHKCLALRDVADTIQQQTRAIFPVFEIEVDPGESYFAIIDEARSELIKLSQEFVQTLARQKQEIECLREQAQRDSMTGLINYRRFMDLLDQETYRVNRYGQAATLVMADIDYFKVINDTYGHQAGDLVLTRIADKLTTCIRSSDVIARYGGEEFGFILPETDLAGAIIITERLRCVVEEMVLEYEGHKLQVTMSFGIASMDALLNLSPRELIREADRALYRAKSSGRNQCCSATEEPFMGSENPISEAK